MKRKQTAMEKVENAVISRESYYPTMRLIRAAIREAVRDATISLQARIDNARIEYRCRDCKTAWDMTSPPSIECVECGSKQVKARVL
jgi:DNA-directed RNA polymerase subunit RPC12/RpoP